MSQFRQKPGRKSIVGTLGSNKDYSNDSLSSKSVSEVKEEQSSKDVGRGTDP